MTNLALQQTAPKMSPSSRRLILLAPTVDQIDSRFAEGISSTDRYNDLLAELQRFRGNIYLQDGAVRASELQADGRHCVDADYSGWHVVAVDGQGEVCGCSRYRIYSPDAHFSELAVGRSALARSAMWRSALIAAIQGERDLARQKRVHFVEVGGWAISAELRRTTEALRIALATYALADYLGGCVGLHRAEIPRGHLCRQSLPIRRIDPLPDHQEWLFEADDNLLGGRGDQGFGHFTLLLRHRMGFCLRRQSAQTGRGRP